MDPAGGRNPINAKCEAERDLPTFRDAYRKRRCIVPADGFFEWKAIKGQKAKQPYAIAMKDGAPFGLAGIWENWREPASANGRPFAIITPMDAASIAGLLITTEAMAAERPKKETPMPAMPPGGGMDY